MASAHAQRDNETGGWTQDTPFPVVFLAGPPQERGYQHGRLFRHRIAAAIAALKATAGVSRWSKIRGWIEQDISLFAQTAPEIFQEIIGIAKGGETDVPDIIAHIGFEYFAASAHGCSALAVRSGNGAIVAQNWDAPAGEHDRLALFIHHDAEGFQAAVVGPIGGLAWAGMNRHGLAFVNNDLLLHGWQRGLPSQIVRRIYLQQASVEAALNVARDIPHMGGRAYLFSDAPGRTVAVEVSATHGAVVLADEEHLMHTNHARDPTLMPVEDRSALRSVYPSSEKRLERMQSMHPRPRTVREVKKFLRDEAGRPNSICKHLSDDEPTQTAFSIIMETAQRRMHLAAGRPSAAPYTEFQL